MGLQLPGSDVWTTTSITCVGHSTWLMRRDRLGGLLCIYVCTHLDAHPEHPPHEYSSWLAIAAMVIDIALLACPRRSLGNHLVCTYDADLPMSAGYSYRTSPKMSAMSTRRPHRILRIIMTRRPMAGLVATWRAFKDVLLAPLYEGGNRIWQWRTRAADTR